MNWWGGRSYRRYGPSHKECKPAHAEYARKAGGCVNVSVTFFSQRATSAARQRKAKSCGKSVQPRFPCLHSPVLPLPTLDGIHSPLSIPLPFPFRPSMGLGIAWTGNAAVRLALRDDGNLTLPVLDARIDRTGEWRQGNVVKADFELVGWASIQTLWAIP